MYAVTHTFTTQPRRVSLRYLNLTTIFVLKNCILCHSLEIFSNGNTVDGFKIEIDVKGSSQREK